MAVRRPIIDLIDRGADPRVPHTKLDKRGNLVVSSNPVPAPVIAKKPDVKENLLNPTGKTDLLTEGEENDKKGEEKDAVVAEKPKADPKKTADKSPKPV